MAIVDLTHTQMLECIDCEGWIFEDELIPERDGDKHETITLRDDSQIFGVSGPYTDDLVNRLFTDYAVHDDDKRRIGIETFPLSTYTEDRSTEDYRKKILNRDRFMVSQIIWETCLNMVEWGNKKDPSKSVRVLLFEGKRGKTLYLQDGGDGFDYEEAFRKAKAGERFTSRDGSYSGSTGLPYLYRVPFEVSYGGNGNILNLKVMNSSIEQRWRPEGM